MKNLVKNEPVVSAAVIAGIVGAVLRLLIAFGVDISSEQVEAILDVVTLATPIVAALVARRFVTPLLSQDTSHNTHVLREDDGDARD